MNPIVKGFAKIQFGGAARAEFYQQMISILRSGRQKKDAARMAWRVASFDGQKKTEGLAIIYNDVANRLENGDKLGDALRPWAPANECSIIAAMEDSENFADSMDAWLRLDTKRRAIIGKSIVELGHPVFLLLMVYIILMYFGIKLMPVMHAIYPMEKWTGMGSAVRGLAVFTQNYAIHTTVAIVAVVFFILYTMPRWSGFGRATFDKIPPWSIYKTFSGIDFLVGVASLMQGRIQEIESVRKIRRGTTSYMASRIDQIIPNLKNGHRLGTSMFMSKYRWPDQKMTMTLKIYEETADLSQSMMRLSDDWLAKAEKSVAMSTRLVKLVAMVSVVVSIIIVIGGTFAVNQQIAQAFGG